MRAVERSRRTVFEWVAPGWTVDGHAPRAVVSGLQLRLVVGTLAVALLLVVSLGAGEDSLGPVTGAVALAVAVGAVVSPTSPLPTVLALVVGLMALDAPLPAWLVLPVGALLHAVHVGASWCAVVAPRAQVEGRVLLPSLRRWALTQLLLLPVAAVLLAGPTLRDLGLVAGLRGLSSTLAGVVLAGLGVVLVVLTVAAVRRRDV
jgi:hypothetical protein